MNDDAYRVVLAELTAKRDALNAAIAALANLLGDAPPAIEVTDLPRRPRPRKGRARARAKPVIKATPPGRRQRARRVQPRGVTTEVAARDEAILTFLRKRDGMARSETIRAAMPHEAGLTEQQQDAAYRNALSRLKTKHLIDRTGDTWSLVGVGSDARA